MCRAPATLENTLSGITVHKQVLVGGEKGALLGHQDFDYPTLAIRIAVNEPGGAEESFIDLDHLTADRGAFSETK